MTLREQLLKEIEVAPDNFLKELLNLCRERNESGTNLQLSVDRPPTAKSALGDNPLEAVKRLQTKLKLKNPDEQSLVDELIAERRSESANE